jgi:hypothetical protein
MRMHILHWAVRLYSSHSRNQGVEMHQRALLSDGEDNYDFITVTGNPAAS